MVDLISYPFRINNTGSVVTIPEGRDYYADELAMLVQTNPGERELVPFYGIKDPTFSKFNKMELLEKVALFGPPVDIKTVRATNYSDGRIMINIAFSESTNDQESTRIEDIEDNEYDEDYEEDDPDYNYNEASDF